MSWLVLRKVKTVELNESEFNRLIKKAKSYAIRRGFGDEAEDFAQEFAIGCFESGIERCVKYDFLNYSDKLRASKRLLSSPEGYLSKNVRVSLDAPIDSAESDSAKLIDLIGVSGDELDSIGYDEQNKSVLTARERLVYEMYFNANMRVSEISKELGVDASTGSQILSGINKKIKKLYEDGEILNQFLRKIKDQEARLFVIKVFKKGIK